MSFGEHLEELRVALWKAVIALVIGTLIGFTVAHHVVRFIQEPLQGGLETFRKAQALSDYEKHLELRKSQGEELDAAAIARAKQLAEEGMIPDVRLFDPEEIIESFRQRGYQIEQPNEAPLPEIEADTDTNADAAAEPEEDEPEETETAAEKLLPLTSYTPLKNDPRTRTIGTGLPDAFMVYVKAALLVGVVLASPAIFFFIWSFVASGMYQHERKYVYIFMPFSLGLFLLGASVAFFFVFQYVLKFLFGFYGWLEIDPTPRIGEWLNFALLLPLGFGIGFQLPLVMLFLERIGIFTVRQYLEYWRIAVLVIFILSMLLTPADPQSMLLMAVPMTFLYFGGVLLCRFMPKRKTPFGDPIED